MSHDNQILEKCFNSIFPLTVFMLIFGPLASSIGRWADLSFFWACLVIFFGFIKYGKFTVPAYCWYFLVLIPLYIFLSLRICFSESCSLSTIVPFIFKPLRIFITVISAYVFIRMAYEKYGLGAQKKLVLWMYYSIFIHSGIMVLQFFSIEFRDLIYGYLNTGEYRSSFDYNFRMGGLTGGSGGAVLSVVQSAGLIAAVFVSGYSRTFNQKIFFAISTVIIFMSIVLSGRSGVWSTVVFVPMAVFLSNRNAFYASMKLVGVGISATAIILGAFYISDLEFAADTIYALGRTFDTFMSFGASGRFEDNTFLVLLDHIILPDQFGVYLFGSPDVLVYTQLDRTLNSDIGYIRNLWGFGLVGSIAYLLPLLILLSMAFFINGRTDVRSFYIILTLVMLVFHMKESFLYVRLLWPMCCLLLASLYFSTSSKYTD